MAEALEKANRELSIAETIAKHRAVGIEGPVTEDGELVDVGEDFWFGEEEEYLMCQSLVELTDCDEEQPKTTTRTRTDSYCSFEIIDEDETNESFIEVASVGCTTMNTVDNGRSQMTSNQAKPKKQSVWNKLSRCAPVAEFLGTSNRAQAAC